MKPGDRVKMTVALKEGLRANGSGEHVEEFGECVGIIAGLVDYNTCKPGESGYEIEKLGPDWDVRWQPSNLRYGYEEKWLEPA